MTSPVGFRPVQQGDHPAAADRAHVAKPAGVSPGHSQEITNGHLKREGAVDGAIQPRIDALRVKLHLASDAAVAKLGEKLLGNTKTIDARIAQLEAQHADHNGFEGRKIRHDIQRLKDLKELQRLTETRNGLCEKSQNLSKEMGELKRKLGDPNLPQPQFLKMAEEYRSKAQEFDRCSMQLKGSPEGMSAAASVDTMDSILGRFSNPPEPVTAKFLREQLSAMEKAFATYAQSSGGAKNAEPYLQSMRRNMHAALSKICGMGLMNHNLNAIPEIFRTIDGLGKAKA